MTVVTAHFSMVFLLFFVVVCVFVSPAESMDEIMSSGAAAVVVQSMRAYPSSESLQLTGAGACWCLATTAENEALVVQAGGLDLNRANLARFPQNAMLLQQVCGAVRNLTVADAHKEQFCSDATSGAGEQPLSGLESCRALVAALRTHASAAALAQQAAGSIAALAMHGPNKSMLGESGAIEAVVAAMQAHPERASLPVVVLDVHDGPAPPRDAIQVIHPCAMTEDLLVDAQHAHRGDAARLDENARADRIRLAELVDDTNAMAGARQQRRCCKTRETGADNGNGQARR